VLNPLGSRQAKNALWKTRTTGSALQKGQHYMVGQKAQLPPIFHGAAFASAHPQRSKVDLKTRALERIRLVIGKAKVFASSGTPSGIDRALKLLEKEFRIGIHVGQAFGSYGISEIEQDPLFRKARDRIISARLLLNESLYADDPVRRTALLEDAASSILNIDADIEFKSRAPLPEREREEKPPVSVRVAPKIYMKPERKGIKETRAEAARKEKELEDRIKAAIEQGRQRMTKWQRKATEKEEKEEEAEAMKLVKEMDAKESGPIKTAEAYRSRKTPEIYKSRKSEAEEA
jgi:hypothetical protein